MDGRFADDNAGALVDNALGGIEHTHNDIPCVADNEDGKSRLENPAEEHGGVEVVHIVLLGNHLDKLVAHHKGKDGRRNGQHHRFGKAAQHIENAAVPRLRGRADIRSDFAHLGVHVIEQATFKNVKKGTYYAGLHAFNRTSEDGKKVFSQWSNVKKVTVK